MQAYNVLYFQGGSIREPEQSTHRRAQVIERAVHRYPANNFIISELSELKAMKGINFSEGYY
jgi:hypothetical protein